MAIPHKCKTVDGAAHAELSPDIGAQLNAAATDRETAAKQAAQAARANAKYGPLATSMASFASQSRTVASDYQSDPAAMAQKLIGANGGMGDYTQALLAARSACQALGVATK